LKCKNHSPNQENNHHSRILAEYIHCTLVFGKIVHLQTPKSSLIDACTIFKTNERRNLAAAYDFYCGKDLEGARLPRLDPTYPDPVFGCRANVRIE